MSSLHKVVQKLGWVVLTTPSEECKLTLKFSKTGIAMQGRYDLSQELLQAVSLACNRMPTDCVLLSGGVDSSLLAAIHLRPAITVILKGSDAPDAHFSQLIAERLKVPWLLIEVSPIEAVKSLCWLMSLRNSFDRGLFNEIPVYWAVNAARARGWRRIVSGEGAELLFAGYDFMVEAGPRFREYRAAVLRQTRHAETDLAHKMAAEMIYPYLAPEVVAVAERTDLDDCIFEYAPGQYLTKVPLRMAARRYLPDSVAWRARADLERGSGFDQLGPAAVDFADAFEPPAVPSHFYWDGTHRALHRIFAGIGLTVPIPQINMYSCQWCNGGVAENKRHCPTCGAFPADRAPSHPA